MWIEFSTPDLQASLFCGSMLPKLHDLMLALAHSEQGFFGLPCPVGLGTSILKHGKYNMVHTG